MRKLALLLLVVGMWGLGEGDAKAQVACTTYYQPVAVYRPAPRVYTSYYVAPAVAAPVVAARVVAAPAVVAAPVYQPVARVRTRYRPFLGGTVTRIRPAYQTYYAPAPVVYAY